MQNESTVWYHYTVTKISKVKKAEHTQGQQGQVELLYTADEDIKWYSHIGKQVGSFLKG